MRTLSKRGDDRLAWDPKDPASVTAASQKFEAHLKGGGSAFSVTKTTKNGLEQEGRGARMDKFDPEAAVVVLVPRLVGG